MANINYTDAAVITQLADVLRGKWAIQILRALLDGPVRLSQLRRTIPGASKKALTASLGSLERTRIIVRKDLSDSVLHVEYELHDQAREPVLSLLKALAEFHRSLVTRL